MPGWLIKGWEADAGWTGMADQGVSGFKRTVKFIVGGSGEFAVEAKGAVEEEGGAQAASASE